VRRERLALRAGLRPWDQKAVAGVNRVCRPSTIVSVPRIAVVMRSKPRTLIGACTGLKLRRAGFRLVVRNEYCRHVPKRSPRGVSKPNRIVMHKGVPLVSFGTPLFAMDPYHRKEPEKPRPSSPIPGLLL